MNKSDLAAAIAKQFDLAKNKSGQIIDAVLENITKALKKGESVPCIGFGTFSVKHQDISQKAQVTLRYSSIIPLYYN